MIWSFIIDYENSYHPIFTIKESIQGWRAKAKEVIFLNQSILNKANELQGMGLKKKDALHVSAAIEAYANFFITVDKGILKKACYIQNIIILNPIDFVEILENN